MVAAADDPPETTIEPHLEMSYNAVMPDKILFYCHSPPSCAGGQTPVCDMRRVYCDMVEHRDHLGTIFNKGVRYSRFLPSRDSAKGTLYSWEKTFYTADKPEVETLLANLGYNVEWLAGDMLHYWYTMASVRAHPRTGHMVWCNQVTLPYRGGQFISSVLLSPGQRQSW